MRLIHTTNYTLHEFYGAQIPKYAVLSHRWEQDEVMFLDMNSTRPETGRASYESRQGWRKISEFCAKAKSEGFEYAWADTCCIDKSSSADLSEAVNSMFGWYRNSALCYVYMSDVIIQKSLGQPDVPLTEYEMTNDDRDSFISSRWFTRGWTLQELLAPHDVHFYSRDWKYIGNRETLKAYISSAAGIQAQYLRFEQCLTASIATKMFWASTRETTREEDMSYCLLGLFDVNMPLLYGEGAEKAFLRLQQQIIRVSEDESIFAWTDSTRKSLESGLLASSPMDFRDSQNIRRCQLVQRYPYAMTNQGLQAEMGLWGPLLNHEFTPPPRYGEDGHPIGGEERTLWIAPLNCKKHGSISPAILSILLIRNIVTNVGTRYYRVGAGNGLSEFPTKEIDRLSKHRVIIPQDMKKFHWGQRDWSREWTNIETMRLRRQHHFVKAAFSDKLVLAPLQLGRRDLRILDSGTADGYWLLDLLPQLSPTAKCYGTDISPNQFPLHGELPSNVKLSVQSIKAPWPLEWQESFDLVHQRAVLSNVSVAELEEVFKGFIGILKPGGWLQLVDGNGRNFGQNPDQPDSALTEFAETYTNFMATFKRRIDPGVGMADVMRRLGLDQVDDKMVEFPIGKKARTEELKELGIEEFLGIINSWRAEISNTIDLLIRFNNGTTLDMQRLDDLDKRLEQELRTHGGKQYWYIAWGRKPL